MTIRQYFGGFRLGALFLGRGGKNTLKWQPKKLEIRKEEKNKKGDKGLRTFFHLRNNKVQGKWTILSNYTSCSNNIVPLPMSSAFPVSWEQLCYDTTASKTGFLNMKTIVNSVRLTALFSNSNQCMLLLCSRNNLEALFLSDFALPAS